jgi:hypothetical protein
VEKDTQVRVINPESVLYGRIGTISKVENTKRVGVLLPGYGVSMVFGKEELEVVQ